MKRHPDPIHRQDVLSTGDWIENSPATKQVPDGQRTAECRRLEFVKDASYAKRTRECPSVTCGVGADDSVETQEMAGNGLNRLR